jgi:hypothetical protein
MKGAEGTLLLCLRKECKQILIHLLEVSMNNMNPWVIEALVEYDQERIRQAMKQIRLEEETLQASRTEEKTTKARVNRSRLLMWIAPTFVKSMFCTGK